MSRTHSHTGQFDIPDIPNYIPRKLKPWIFILFVIIIQFSGGLYLAAASDMVGTKALMQEDILMAGYAQLIGMSINFCVMFRLKFRFSNRMGLLFCGTILIVCSYVCMATESVIVLVAACLIAGWFRMWGTFICNSTIQLWLTPTRDMSVFFCFVYLLVDGVIQLSGLGSVYASFFNQWEMMHAISIGSLAIMMLLVIIIVKPTKGPMQIPLLGIDWLGAALWSIFMLCFTFICVYGNHYDWWESAEITGATVIGLVCCGINLWRATFLHHPYISFAALTNHNVIRATIVYLIFFTLLATEHVFEHSYAATILGYDETNLIDLNWYVLIGIVSGVGFTYFTFAKHRWSYKALTAIGFSLAGIYLAYFYFLIDYGVEKEMLALPLICRGAASVIISIVYLTSIVQSGLHFFVFPQALTVNGFTGAVMGATFGPAIIGEALRHTVAKNVSLMGTDINLTDSAYLFRMEEITASVYNHALLVSIKEIYGWLLIACIITLTIICVSFGPIKPFAIMPKWKTIKRSIRRQTRSLPFSGN